MQRLFLHTAMRKNKFFCESMSAEKNYSECMNYTERKHIGPIKPVIQTQTSLPAGVFCSRCVHFDMLNFFLSTWPEWNIKNLSFRPRPSGMWPERQNFIVLNDLVLNVRQPLNNIVLLHVITSADFPPLR